MFGKSSGRILSFKRNIISLNQNFKKQNQSLNFCRNCSQKVDRNATHFGFQTVSPEEKSIKVKEVFSSVAQKYDLMNDVMSLGIHRFWKKEMIKLLNPMPATNLLDVCGGTGDIAFEFIKYVDRNESDHNSRVVVCDFSEQMLKVGQKKAKHLNENQLNRIQWVLGDALNLPFDDNSFDVYTIAFGIRNVVDISQTLREAHRVLKSGGQFLCLEFSQMQTPLISRVYDWYSFEIIPVLGEILAKDWNSYQYLVESIRRFPDQNEFKAMIKSSGFTFVEFFNLLDGIASIHRGFKK